MRRRRWACRPVGAGRRKVSPRAALKSVAASQGAAAARRAGKEVRRVGVGSLVVEVSAAKATRRGVARSAGDWWSRVMVTCSGYALRGWREAFGGGMGGAGESNLVAAPALREGVFA
jgi:hypothetical protein